LQQASSARADDRAPLSRGAPQDRVDEPGAAAAAVLGELDALVDGRVLRHAVEQQQLEKPEPHGGDYGRIEGLRRPCGQACGDVVERRAPLDGAVGEPHRQRALAGSKGPGLRGKRAVGVGPLLEDTAQDRKRARAGR